MKVKAEKLDHNMAKLTVTIPAEEFEAATVKAYNKNKNRFAVPGFRKGKTPKAMIEKIYGKGIFYEDAVDFLLNDTYPEAAKQSKLDITSRPEIDIVTLEDGKDFVYSALVATKPEVKLGKYKGVAVEKADASVAAAEVTERLNQIREQNARIVAIEDAKRKIKKDDIVTIDFEGFVDGKPFDGGKGSDYPLTIGSHSFIDTFEDQLKGHKAGEEVEVNVTFPADYQAKQLAGKPALFKVLVKEIKEKQLPELDDEFASEVSEFDTLKDYKASLKKELEEQKERAAAQENENRVISAVVDLAEADIPQVMVGAVADNMVEDYAQRLTQQGIPFDQFMKITGQTREKLREDMMEQARRNILTNLVLEAVADKEKIEVTDDKVEEHLKQMAETYKMDIETIRSIMGDRLEELKADHKVQAAIDWLVAEAKLTAAKKAVKEVKEEKAEKAEKAAKAVKEKTAEEKPAKKTCRKKKED